MNKQLFTNGQPFNYTGKFVRIAKRENLKPIKWAFEQDKGLMVNQDDRTDHWQVTSLTDNQFIVYKRVFGKIVIAYSECVPAKEDNP